VFIKELIVNKLYDSGKIDDNQKNQMFEKLEDVSIPMSRHFMLKCIHSFIKLPNEHL
jgi:hypothetical protein